MKTTIAAIAACLAFGGLSACERGDQAPRNIGGGPPPQESQAYTEQVTEKDIIGDRGVLKLENAGMGTGPASAPYAHATASDVTGAQHVYQGKNADTFRLREEPPTAIGGGPKSGSAEGESQGAQGEDVQSEGAHDGGK
ncbi:MAG: hypothetical protein HYV09_23925 [Deltaproteobacteria bacterium]|nr:hypothetical protein [Deltaproteobacteria bacterium]